MNFVDIENPGKGFLDVGAPEKISFEFRARLAARQVSSFEINFWLKLGINFLKVF